MRRFFSDLNPEATFVERRAPQEESENREPNDDIGVWVDKREWDELVRQKNRRSSDPTLDYSLEDKPGNNQRPHSTVLGPLIDVYFRKIHPILPLLDEVEFRRNFTTKLVPEPLVFSICLVAAKDPEAEPYLKFAGSSVLLPPREFCRGLHATIMKALRIPSRYEKVSVIRIMALVSLHAEGQDGAEEATLCLNQAMHYVQTLGWHLGQQTGATSGDGLTTKRLFWCLWSLDRLNSVIYGRPIMMSDIDIAIEPFESGESGFIGFEIWLRICGMLNKVIGFYRPGNSLSVTGWEEDFPGFESVIDEGQGWNLPQSLLATLHLFYLVVAILSHRSRGLKPIPPSTASCFRQNLCSIKLIRLMSSHQFTSLHPLPILPYAISLALSVSYQHLRRAQLQHQQEDARQDFATCCSVLQRLRRTWSSADTITTIARKVLDEIDKAPDLSSCRILRAAETNRASPGICPASLSRPTTLLGDSANEHARESELTSSNVRLDPNHHISSAMNHDTFGLLEGMDDIFGTYLDPNYPVNLDDFSFGDDVATFD